MQAINGACGCASPVFARLQSAAAFIAEAFFISKIVLHAAKSLAETLKVYNLTLS